MRIHDLLKMSPETLLIHSGALGTALADREVIQSYWPFKSKSRSFDDIIYQNDTWLVRGDATVESKVPRRGYQIEGSDILDGTSRKSKLQDFWPYHVCQKTWVNAQDFCNAYCLAFVHLSMIRASDALAEDDAKERRISLN